MAEKVKIEDALLNGCIAIARKNLNDPRIALYDNIEKLAAGKRITPLEIAQSCSAIEHLFGVHNAVIRTIDGKFGSEFANIYALNAGALVGLSKINEKAISLQLNEIDFSDSHFLCERLMKEYVQLVKRSKTSDIAQKTAGFLDDIMRQAAIKKETFSKEAQEIAGLYLQIKDVTINGFRKIDSDTDLISAITIDDVVGNNEMIEKLKRSVEIILCYDARTKSNVFNKYGFQKFFFIYGSPGTGKTTGIKAIINYAQQLSTRNGKEIKIELISNEFKSEFYSKSSQNLRNCLNKIFKGDCIYIAVIEDIDTVFFRRDFSLYDNENKANLGEFLNLVDGMKTRDLGNYIIIATTNHTVDDAQLGRLGECIIKATGPETKEDYERLIKIQLRGCINDCLLNLDFDDAALLCHKYKLNGRDVKNVCSIIKSTLFDFEKTQNFYSMKTEEQIEYIKRNCCKITKEATLHIINDYVMKKREHYESVSIRSSEIRSSELSL